MFIPDFKISTLADDYLKAAELCAIQRLFSPTIMNAAFSCELYMKSFLATPDISCYPPIIKEDETFVFYTVAPKTKRGHKLFNELYERIHPDLKTLIAVENEKINPIFDLTEQLTKFDNTFADSRYSYESSSKMHSFTDLSIIELAKHLKALVSAVATYTHPKAN